MTTTMEPLEDQLTADFYNYEALLSDEERKILLTARTFMRDEVKPLVNENWAAGTFPKELIAKFRESGLAGLPYERLLPALRAVNVNPLERPVVDLGF